MTKRNNTKIIPIKAPEQEAAQAAPEAAPQPNVYIIDAKVFEQGMDWAFNTLTAAQYQTLMQFFGKAGKGFYSPGPTK